MRWIYRVVEVVRVVDGDTLYLRVERDKDFGFRRKGTESSVEHFRLLGIDTPERKAPTKDMGDLATQRLTTLLSQGGILGDMELQSLAEDDMYGRWLARIKITPYLGLSFDLADQMIKDGYARAYDGKGKRLPWDPSVAYPLERA